MIGSSRIGSGGPEWIFLQSRNDALAACASVEERRAAGEPLALYGVPFGVKDNMDVAGMPTTAACPSFSRVPERSAQRRAFAAGGRDLPGQDQS